MKILLIHYKISYPIRSRVDKTIHSLIKILRTAHEVSLMVPVFADTDPQALEYTRALCDYLITMPVKAPDNGWLARRWNYFRILFLGVFARVPWLVSMNWFQMSIRARDLFDRVYIFDAILPKTLAIYQEIKKTPHAMEKSSTI